MGLERQRLTLATTMKTQLHLRRFLTLSITAAVLGWASPSRASDAYEHAASDSHHAGHDQAAAHAASDHAQASYGHAVHAASHGDFSHAVSDFRHAARDAHSAGHASAHSHASTDHAASSYSGHSTTYYSGGHGSRSGHGHYDE